MKETRVAMRTRRVLSRHAKDVLDELAIIGLPLDQLADQLCAKLKIPIRSARAAVETLAQDREKRGSAGTCGRTCE